MFNRLQSRRASSLLGMPRRKFAKANPASQEPFSVKQFAAIICSYLEAGNRNNDVEYDASRDQGGKAAVYIRGKNSKFDDFGWEIDLQISGLDVLIRYDVTGGESVKKRPYAMKSIFYFDVEMLANNLVYDLEKLIEKEYNEEI